MIKTTEEIFLNLNNIEHVIVNLNTFQANETYIIDKIYVFENDYIFPKNITLIFKPEGGFVSNDGCIINSNNTTIISDPITIFGKKLVIRCNFKHKVYDDNTNKNILGEWLPWKADYFYSEWFEKDTALDDNFGHDDGIEINKVFFMNSIPFYEYRERTDDSEMDSFFTNDYQWNATNGKVIRNGCAAYSGTLKLLNKDYYIKQPLIVRGMNIIGSGKFSSTINCQVNGNWDIKRSILPNNNYPNDEINSKASKIIHIWKRAAIYYPSDAFGSNSSTHFSNFQLNLNNCETNGIIMERVQDGTKINDITILGLHFFYSGLKIEPTVWKQSIVCDENFKPIPKTDPYYTTFDWKLPVTSSSTTTYYRWDWVTKYNVINEGIVIDNVYIIRYAPLLDSYLGTPLDISTSEYNNRYKYNLSGVGGMLGIFPTYEEKNKKVKWYNPDTNILENSEVSEYEMFTPNGHNTGVCVLRSTNETTITRCGFSAFGSDDSSFVAITGVSLELIDCDRLNVTDGGSGFCRIGLLIRAQNKNVTGLNYANNMYEQIGVWKIGSMIEKDTISEVHVTGSMLLGGNNFFYSPYCLGKGTYDYVIDPNYNQTILFLKWNSNSYHVIIKPKIRDYNFLHPVEMVNLNVNPLIHVRRNSTPKNNVDGISKLQLFRNYLLELLDTHQNDSEYMNKNGFIILQILDSTIDIYDQIYEELPRKSSLFDIALGGRLTADDLVQVDTLVKTVMSNYPNKSEISELVRTLILANNVTLDLLLNAINTFISYYPQYDITFENDKLTLYKNGKIIKLLSLPFVKSIVPTIVNSVGKEDCLGKGCIVE